MIVFVVWFALVIGIAQHPGWPESWGVAYAIISVLILLLASCAIVWLERRDLERARQEVDRA